MAEHLRRGDLVRFAGNGNDTGPWAARRTQTALVVHVSDEGWATCAPDSADLDSWYRAKVESLVIDGRPIRGPRRDHRGIVVGPQLYPRLLRRAADALDALHALGDPDPRNFEGGYEASADPIEVWGNDEIADRPEGWLALVDSGTWVFVPYVPEIEETDRG